MSEAKRARPMRLLVVAAVLGSVVAIDTLVWFLTCRRLDDAARDVAASGWTLSAGQTRWRGWPFAAEIVLPDAALRAGPDTVATMEWTATVLILRIAMPHFFDLGISVAGPQSVTLGGVPPIRFTAATQTLSIDLTGRDPVRLRATGLDIAAPAGPIRIARAELEMRADDLMVELEKLSLPGSNGRPIQPPLDTLRLTARLSTPVVPMPSAAQSARRWRDNDGHLAIDDVASTWGSVAATGRATVTLDATLQPVLSGQIAATGLLAMLDQLVDAGSIDASGAMAARGILAILSTPAGTGPVSLPIAFQSGVVSVARIPLLRISPLRWE